VVAFRRVSAGAGADRRAARGAAADRRVRGAGEARGLDGHPEQGRRTHLERPAEEHVQPRRPRGGDRKTERLAVVASAVLGSPVGADRLRSALLTLSLPLRARPPGAGTERTPPSPL